MRLWSLHPKYLDPAGLVAAWREALLARAVLAGKTTGYRRHPQLDRFREHTSPGAAVGQYLRGLLDEAERRGYAFDRRKVPAPRSIVPLPVTSGQLAFEWRHLLAKVRTRNRAWWQTIRHLKRPRAHPCFAIVPGGVAPWERNGPR